MTIYKGFAFHRSYAGAPVGVHAQELDATGAWSGRGWVGRMPDVATAKAYVDWLQATGPDAATELTLGEEVTDGHVVAVHGNRGDEDARLIDRLGRVSADLEANGNTDPALRRIFGDLVWTIHALEIAADQRGAAKAFGNFFMQSGVDGMVRLHLGNFSETDEWSGDGLVAVGLGDGWVRPLIDRLLVRPIAEFPTSVSPATAPSGYARSVFVGGAEPALDERDLGNLKLMEDTLSNALSRGPAHSYRLEVVRYVTETLSEILGGLRARFDQEPAAGPPNRP